MMMMTMMMMMMIGIRDTLTIIRERFWIIPGRESVKRLIKGCVICRKAEGRTYTCGMVPDLPAGFFELLVKKSGYCVELRRFGATWRTRRLDGTLS